MEVVLASATRPRPGRQPWRNNNQPFAQPKNRGSGRTKFLHIPVQVRFHAREREEKMRMPVLARLWFSVGMTALSSAACWAVPTMPDQPVLPGHARHFVAPRQWTSLLLDALNGNAEAAAEVGQAYTQGPSRDINEAMRWLSRGADLGSATAKRELGLLLLRGDQTTKDPDHAA